MTRNNYKPSPSKRKEHRVKARQTDQIHSVDLGKKHNKISFWSFSLTGVRANTVSRKFRVYTTHNIPIYNIRKCLVDTMPMCIVLPVWGYDLRNTFDVSFPTPIRWDYFIKEATRALEKLL